MSRKRLLWSAAAIVALAIAAPVLADFLRSQDVPPEGMQRFSDVRAISLSSQGSDLAGDWAWATMKIVELKDGSQAVPVLEIQHVMHGGGGTRVVREDPHWVIGQGGVVHFPIDQGIERVYFLIQRFRQGLIEQDEWRVFELRRDEIASAGSILVPALATLPALDSMPTAEKWSELMRAARQHYRENRDR